MLSDVFEEVKRIIDEKFPADSAFPNGVEQKLGFKDLLGHNGSFPRVVWLIPTVDQARFDRSLNTTVGGSRPQLNTEIYPVRIVIWTKELEDQEEDLAKGRRAGFLIEYKRAIHKVMPSASYKFESHGWDPSDSSSAGFCYHLLVSMQFQLNAKEAPVKTVRKAEIATG